MRILLRLVLTIVMDVLLLVAAILVARIIIGFFGKLGAAAWATQFMDFTAPYLPRLGFGTIASPYKGVFDVNAGAVLGIVLVAEWVVAFVRRIVK